MTENRREESQIKRIADGTANRQKQYQTRSQPQGQRPNTSSREVIELTTIPSSSGPERER